MEEILTLFAFARLSGARGVFILTGLTTLRLIIMAPREERELRAHTGAADEDYARRVPRFSLVRTRGGPREPRENL